MNSSDGSPACKRREDGSRPTARASNATDSFDETLKTIQERRAQLRRELQDLSADERRLLSSLGGRDDVDSNPFDGLYTDPDEIDSVFKDPESFASVRDDALEELIQACRGEVDSFTLFVSDRERLKENLVARRPPYAL
jgi:hypothetical protein